MSEGLKTLIYYGLMFPVVIWFVWGLLGVFFRKLMPWKIKDWSLGGRVAALLVPLVLMAGTAAQFEPESLRLEREANAEAAGVNQADAEKKRPEKSEAERQRDREIVAEAFAESDEDWRRRSETIALAQIQAENLIDVPSDPSHTYYLRDITHYMSEKYYVDVESHGPGGSIYSRRVVDCDFMRRGEMRSETIVEAATLEAFRKKLGARPHKRMPIIPGSITYYVADHACRKARE